MNPEDSIQNREEKNSEKIWPKINDHINYLNDIYNLCFSVQFKMDDKPVSDFSNTYYAQMILLMRITDFLRSIQLLAVKGYPEQAGTLAASIFELAHTAVYFSYNPETAEKWLSAESIGEQTKDILKLNWQRLTEANAKHFNGTDGTNEYNVYRQLCWLKHSLPKMQGLIRTKQCISFHTAPYSDERSISHAWFSIEHAGRLTEFVLLSLDAPAEIYSHIQESLKPLSMKRLELHEEAKSRFEINNPFN